MNEIYLETCPFRGSKAAEIRHGYSGYRTACNQCGALGPAPQGKESVTWETPEQAAASWNGRANERSD